MPDPNPSERLAEIEARVEAATEGPWRAPQGNERILTNVGEAYEAGPMRGGKRGDAEFTAHARSDIPWLLEQVREARKDRDELHRIAQDALAKIEAHVLAALADSGEAG